MTKISRAALFEALNAYVVPGTNASLTTLKAIKGIDVTEGKVTVLLQLMEAYQDRVQVIKQALEELILNQPGVAAAEIEIGWGKTAPVEFKNLIPGIKRCVVVGSGKAGGRLRQAHACWVGAHLCHLWILWFQLFDLEKSRAEPRR